MLASVLLFSLNDVVGKWLVATYAVGQVMVLRGLGSLMVLGPLAWRRLRASGWRVPQPWLQALRVLLGALECACFYWAVGHTSELFPGPRTNQGCDTAKENCRP